MRYCIKLEINDRLIYNHLVLNPDIKIKAKDCPKRQSGASIIDAAK